MSVCLFISHAGADSDRALALADAIESAARSTGLDLTVWLDKRPGRLRAGEPWQEQLEHAVEHEATAFALLLTREGARNWVRFEVRAALDRVVSEQRNGRRFPFIPIIADDPADIGLLPAFARQFQGVRLDQGPAGIQELVRAAVDLPTGAPVALVEEPFMGLDAFGSEDAALFFGRDAEVKALVARLKKTNLLVVVGESGAGKSSLVKAGLIPAVREGALADPLGRRPDAAAWHVVEMRPGRDPFEELVKAAQSAARAAGVPADTILALGPALRSRNASSILDALRLSGPHDAKLLLVVDQLEELWTQTIDDQARTDFLDAMLLLAPPGETSRRIVGTMRRDYFNLCADHTPLWNRLNADDKAGRLLLGAMGPEGLRAAVEKPLMLAGIAASDAKALADAVLLDVTDQAGNLALLEMALTEAWRRRHLHGGDLVVAYDAIGRLEGALATAAEDVYLNAAQDPEMLLASERTVAEALFMRLVRAGDGGGFTRRIAHEDELSADALVVARKFTTRRCRRLLVSGRGRPLEGDDEAVGEEAGAGSVELAHEQLATQWARLRRWLRRSGEEPLRGRDKRILDRLMDAARRWAELGRRTEDVAQGGDLDDYLALAGRHKDWLSPLERDFLEQGKVARADRERERENALKTIRELASRRLWQLRAGSAVALLFLGLAGLLGWQWTTAARLARSEAKQRDAAVASAGLAEARLIQAQRREALRLAPLVRQELARGDATTAMLLALEGLPRDLEKPDKPLVGELASALDAALAAPRIELISRGHQDEVYAASFSPDGARVVSAGRDGTVRLWQADGSGALLILRGHVGSVRAASFSPDGTRVVSAGYDGTVRLWRADGSGEPLILRGHEGAVIAAAFNPDGTRVVSGGADGTVRLWQADGSSAPLILRGHERAVNAGSFSPDGARVVSAGRDGTVRLWRADGSGEPLILRGHVRVVYAASFSRDGTRVVSAGEDGTVRLWRADGSGEPLILRGHQGDVYAASFSPDGMRVVTAGVDATVRLRLADGSGEPLILRGHRGGVLGGGVHAASFSLDGTRVVSAGYDGTVRLWRVNGSGEPLILRGHQGDVYAASFSPDGMRVVSAGDDQVVRLWRPDGSGEPLILRGAEDGLNAASFSRDGRRVVSAGARGWVGLWAADGSGEPLSLRGHRGDVKTASFSTDGKWVVSAGRDRGVRLWRADGSGEPLILGGHQDEVYAASFSPDGTRVVSAGVGGTIGLWRTDGSGAALFLRGHRDTVYAASFSPDGTRVVSAGMDRTVRLWRADGSGAALILRGHQDNVYAASFSPDGTRVVSAGDDGTVRLWRADGSGEPLILRGHMGRVRAASFSPDGTRVVSAGDDGTVRLWPYPATDRLLLERARGSVPREFAGPTGSAVPLVLTAEQRRRFFLEDAADASAATPRP
ncbi:TIR domain-containing protein [Falsiroseomonas sp. HC035]|uniref:nSTAND1 domain-containing NTPase n=1 Tax=Falsiroseomonas sp. HC035 TaxID=3390999 RepID=UPI003D30F6B9